MSFNAFAIMLKPFIANYLAPLEENGTIAKLQSDVELVAKSNVIPELATLVSELKRHNELLERLAVAFAERKADYERLETDTDTGTAGFVRDNRDGMLELPRPD